jgi:ubiquinone/menaquinone biosynthesis C-methylase UbiE
LNARPAIVIAVPRDEPYYLVVVFLVQSGPCRLPIAHRNIDTKTVEGFGREWSTFHSISNQQDIFEDYFRIFPWHLIDNSSVGLDFGCGTGRWAALVAPKVKSLSAVDASLDALMVARKNLGRHSNIYYHITIPRLSFDFAYSLGVLHHVPDTQAAINDIYVVLKPGAPFLVYLYYAFDNRPHWYRLLWQVSDIARKIICRLPYSLQLALTSMIAAFVYWPISRISWQSWPLSYYYDKSFYVMRTDAFDRFCTRLEKRFTKEQIRTMLERAGFKDIRFSDRVPYWCAVGIK